MSALVSKKKKFLSANKKLSKVEHFLANRKRISIVNLNVIFEL